MRWNRLPSLHYDYDCLQHTCIPALTDPSSGKRPAAALSAAGQLAVVGGAGARPFASCRLRPARRCAAREPGGAREPGRRARHLPAHQGAVGRHQCRGRAGRDVPLARALRVKHERIRARRNGSGKIIRFGSKAAAPDASAQPSPAVRRRSRGNRPLFSALRLGRRGDAPAARLRRRRRGFFGVGVGDDGDRHSGRHAAPRKA